MTHFLINFAAAVGVLTIVLGIVAVAGFFLMKALTYPGPRPKE